MRNEDVYILNPAGRAPLPAGRPAGGITPFKLRIAVICHRGLHNISQRGIMVADRFPGHAGAVKE